jgi:hypothetical protein
VAVAGRWLREDLTVWFWRCSKSTIAIAIAIVFYELYTVLYDNARADAIQR